MFHRNRAPRLIALSVLTILATAPRPSPAQDVTKIADLTTPIPGGTGNFTRLSHPQVSLGNIVFTGAGANNQLGIYRLDPLTRALSPIVDNNNARPPGGWLAPFDQLGMSVYGPDVSFIGLAQGIGNALYTTRGGLRRGGVTYTSQGLSTGLLTNPILQSSGGFFAFSDAGGISGPIPPNFHLPGEPNTSYTFSGMGIRFADDGQDVVIYAESSTDPNRVNRTRWGLYRTEGRNTLRTVANNHTIIPGGDGVTTFSFFSPVAIDGPNVIFSGNSGLFLESGGNITKLPIPPTLDGKTFGITFSGDRPLSGNDLVFTANFPDGTSGLYHTTIPEPATILLAAAATLTLARRATRRTA